MKKNLCALLLFSVLIAAVFSCSKQNEKDLGGGVICDTSNMTFNADIQPILQNYCFSCHGNGLSENGVNFDTYAGVKAVADNGKLIGAITHAPGFVAMPQSAPKLSDCNINRIKDWVSHGAADN
jgi:cytochrome c553